MTSLFKIIVNFLKKVIDLLSNHGDKVAKGAAATGVAAAVVGVGAGIHANSVNKKAIAIQEEAMSAFKKSNALTEKVLEQLGNLQIEMIGTFDSFVETMEKIKQCPKKLNRKFAKVTLPDFKPDELKTVSNNLQMAIAGTGGTAAGIGVGVAAFGVNALALSPGALVGGVVLCVKGVSLSKKAAKNKHEAIQIKRESDKICRFHSQLRDSANLLYQSMLDVKPQYIAHFADLKKLVSQKTNYNEYSKEEKELVDNSKLLFTLIYNMCNVTLVRKAEDEKSMETVNEKEAERAVQTTKLSLSKIIPIAQTPAV